MLCLIIDGDMGVSCSSYQDTRWRQFAPDEVYELQPEIETNDCPLLIRNRLTGDGPGDSDSVGRGGGVRPSHSEGNG